MKVQQLSLVVAIATAALTVGCATTGKPGNGPAVGMGGRADAVIYVSGLS